MPKRVPKAPPVLPEVKITPRPVEGEKGVDFKEEPSSKQPEEEKRDFEEKVIQIDRVTYVVAGGKKLRFRALVVVGDKNGRVGVGVAKASAVPDAIVKATSRAKKRLISVSIKNGTIPYEIKYKFGSAKIFLKPASPGTGLIAGGPIKAVIELVGITDILSKMLGSENKINNVFATYEALKKFKNHETART